MLQPTTTGLFSRHFQNSSGEAVTYEKARSHSGYSSLFFGVECLLFNSSEWKLILYYHLLLVLAWFPSKLCGKSTILDHNTSSLPFHHTVDWNDPAGHAELGPRDPGPCGAFSSSLEFPKENGPRSHHHTDLLSWNSRTTGKRNHPFVRGKIVTWNILWRHK